MVLLKGRMIAAAIGLKNNYIYYKENKIYPASVPVLGIDATPNDCNAVLDGSMRLTVYQSAKGQSKSSVDAAIQLASGGNLDKIENLAEDKMHIWVPFEKVDKSNVKQYM